MWEFLAWILTDHDRTQRLHSLIITIGACVARIVFAVAGIVFAVAGIMFAIQFRLEMWACVLAAVPTVITITLAIRGKKYQGKLTIMGDRKNRSPNPDE